jgi:ubiquinone biosynthesis protein UbiJ
MSWSIGAGELAKKVAQFYEELVTTRVEFKELRRQATETLSEFKSAIQRLHDQAQIRELKHAEEVADLKAQVGALNARLDMLSEQALHAAVREVARERITKAVP